MPETPALVVFAGYGCQISSQAGGLRVIYNSGQAAGGRTLSHAITPDEATLIQSGEDQAYRVILAARKRDGLEP